MSDREKQLSVDQLTEAVASGVLRALEARVPSDEAVDFRSVVKEGGLFGSIHITCGIWPPDLDRSGGLLPPRPS
jgi:hypothetical protein